MNTILLREHIENLRRSNGPAQTIADLERYEYLVTKYGFTAMMRVKPEPSPEAVPQQRLCRDCVSATVYGRTKYCTTCQKIRQRASEARARIIKPRTAYWAEREQRLRLDPVWLEKRRAGVRAARAKKRESQS